MGDTNLVKLLNNSIYTIHQLSFNSIDIIIVDNINEDSSSRAFKCVLPSYLMVGDL